MQKRYLVGVDLGTSGTKAALYQIDGKLISDASVEVPLFYPKPGVVEQENEDFYASAAQTIKRCVDSSGVEPEAIAAIAFDSQMAGVGLIDEDFIAAHTRGFHELKETVKKYRPKIAANICAIAECSIVEAALAFGMAKTALSLWSMGVNQSSVGVHKNNTIHNLHLATGKIGKPGCGPFSLTGQPNAMGGREVGGLSHLLPGYRSVADAEDRATVERFWRVAPGSIAGEPGLAVLEQFEALAQGGVKAIWILCTNPRFRRRISTSSRRCCGRRNSWWSKTRIIRPRPVASRTFSCRRRNGARRKA